MKKTLVLLIGLVLTSNAFGDSPPARSINSRTFDATDNAITSTVDGAKRALDCHVSNTTAAPGNTSLIVGGSVIDPRDTRALTTSDEVSCAQLGTWDVNNISGTVSLPTGAATEAKQDTGNTSLGSIDGKITNTTGGAVKVDGSAFTNPVSQSGNWNSRTQDGSGTAITSTLIDGIHQAIDVNAVGISTATVGDLANAGTITTTCATPSAACAVGSEVVLSINGVASAQVQISGTFSGASLGVYGTVDGSSWVALLTASGATGSYSTTPITATGKYRVFRISGLTQIRVVATALASGSVDVDINASIGSNLTEAVQLTASNLMTSAVQSGTWNLNNISGIVSLPTGAATSANQATTNASLSSIDGKIETTVDGIKVDGSAVTQPVSASALPLPTGAATSAAQTTGNGSLSSIDGKLTTSVDGLLVDGSAVTQPVSAASLPLPTGAATAANQATANASLSSIDGKLSSVISVDGSGFTQPVSAASLPLPTGAATAAKQDTGNASVASIDGKLGTLGQKAMASSAPVVIASNQSTIPVDGSGVTQPISAVSLPLPSGAATNSTVASGNTILSSIDSKTIARDLDTGAGSESAQQVNLRFSGNGGSVEAGTNSNPFRVDPTGSTTQPVSAVSLPLPTGAATAANQTTANSSLSSIDGKLTDVATATAQATGNSSLSTISGKLGTLGQKAMTGSAPVVLASDQSAIPVSQSGTWNVTNISGTVSLPTGAATSANQTTANSSLSSIDTKTPSLGQATMANSRPVVIASNQSSIPVAGDVAAGSSDSGNPVKVGGRYTTSTPSLTTGQRGDVMLDKMSNVRANTGGTSFVSYGSPAQTGTVIKSGAGRLVNVCLTTKGANTDTLTLWDNTAASGTIITDITLGGTAIPLQCARIDAEFSTGLTITTTGTTSRWTIVYQ